MELDCRARRGYSRRVSSRLVERPFHVKALVVEMNAATISTAMIAATAQSTTRQKGGHQRVWQRLTAVLPEVFQAVAGEGYDGSHGVLDRSRLSPST